MLASCSYRRNKETVTVAAVASVKFKERQHLISMVGGNVKQKGNMQNSGNAAVPLAWPCLSAMHPAAAVAVGGKTSLLRRTQ